MATLRHGLAEDVSALADDGSPGSAPEAPEMHSRDAPVMNRREVGLRLDDERHGRHWSRAQCWCHAVHPAESADLILVPPPWDETRDLEFVAAAGNWS